LLTNFHQIWRVGLSTSPELRTHTLLITKDKHVPQVT